jgi:hypothetical protein
VAGAVAVVLLVVSGAVPPTAVGVPGAERSNLDPPSAATIALALAQSGAAALLLPRLARAGRVLDGLRTVGRRAYPVFLAHQGVLVAVWLVTLPLGPLHGLHDGPGAPGWLVARIGWVLVVAAVLGTGLRTRGRVRRRRSLSGGARADWAVAVSDTRRHAVRSDSNCAVGRGGFLALGWPPHVDVGRHDGCR